VQNKYKNSIENLEH